MIMKPFVREIRQPAEKNLDDVDSKENEQKLHFGWSNRFVCAWCRKSIRALNFMLSRCSSKDMRPSPFWSTSIRLHS